MKKISLVVKNKLTTESSDIFNWLPKQRIIVRTKLGLKVGTISKVNDYVFVINDDGSKVKVKVGDSSIIGEAIQRKCKSVIPDDELYQWKLELSNGAMNKVKGFKC